MQHSTSLVQIILKNLRLLHEANEKGLHYTALDLSDKKHFENHFTLIQYLMEQQLVESDYDESVGVWFLSDYGMECYRKGHFETVDNPEDFDFTEKGASEEIEEQKYHLSDSISITTKQFTTIGKYLWLVMFVVIALVVLENYLYPKEEAFPFTEEELELMKSSIDEQLKVKIDSIKRLNQ